MTVLVQPHTALRQHRRAKARVEMVVGEEIPLDKRQQNYGTD